MSAPIDDKVPVAPLELPVIVSPTVKVPLGIPTVRIVEELTSLTELDCPLVPPVIVSLVVKVPVTEVNVS